MSERPDADIGFDEPWQAYALVIARELCERGLFSRAEWSERLGAARRMSLGDDHADYYSAVLAALESLIVEKRAADASELLRIKERWRRAYEATPHGKPVELGSDY